MNSKREKSNELIGRRKTMIHNCIERVGVVRSWTQGGKVILLYSTIQAFNVLE
jgi:hypothetical protein